MRYLYTLFGAEPPKYVLDAGERFLCNSRLLLLFRAVRGALPGGGCLFTASWARVRPCPLLRPCPLRGAPSCALPALCWGAGAAARCAAQPSPTPSLHLLSRAAVPPACASPTPPFPPARPPTAAGPCRPLIPLPCAPAGANAGFSTILFKLLWPEAIVVMLEPDPSNFAILSRNVAT